MLDLNIVYKSKYHDTFHVEHSLYSELITEFVKEKKKVMNKNERIRYKWYRLTKGIKFGSTYSGVPVRKAILENGKMYYKSTEKWELHELYYEVGKVEDYLGEIYN